MLRLAAPSLLVAKKQQLQEFLSKLLVCMLQFVARRARGWEIVRL
jgi:hypothetical protein